MSTNSRGTRVWRRFIIHREATQRQSCCASKHTRKSSPVSTNCIKLHVQLPRHHSYKINPHSSLKNFKKKKSVHLSASSPVASAQKARYRWWAHRRLWESGCARSLRESVPHLVQFLVWTWDKMKSQRSSPGDGFMSEPLGDFFSPLRTQIPGSSCLAPTTLPNWTRSADLTCYHQLEQDTLPVLLSK